MKVLKRVDAFVRAFVSAFNGACRELSRAHLAVFVARETEDVWLGGVQVDLHTAAGGSFLWSTGGRDADTVFDGRALDAAFTGVADLLLASGAADGVASCLAFTAAETGLPPAHLEDVAGGFVADRVAFTGGGVEFLR